MDSHRTGAKRAVSDGNITKMWKESKEKDKIDKEEKRIEISGLDSKILRYFYLSLVLYRNNLFNF